METKIDIQQLEPEAYKIMLEFEKYLARTKLGKLQRELIKIRASQINGCAYCLNMHTRDARKYGETEQRIYTLSAWRDTPYFTEEEQALLALTEEVTLISNHVSAATKQRAIDVIGEQGLAQAIMAIVIINSWNRISIASGSQPPLDQ